MAPIVEVDREAGLSRFERQTTVPMLVLSLAVIPLLVIPLASELSSATETTFLALSPPWSFMAAPVAAVETKSAA